MQVVEHLSLFNIINIILKVKKKKKAMTGNYYYYLTESKRFEFNILIMKLNIKLPLYYTCKH